MKKFLPFSRRQPSLDRYTVNRGGWAGSGRFGGKSLRRTSATCLNTRSIQVVRGAYNIDLNKVDSSFTKLHRACLLNDDAQVRKHIHKVDCNSHDSSNRYPIHLASVNGNLAVVKLLIENGADPNVRDNEDSTPLIKSIESGHEHLVKYLLNNGADPNLSDQDNNTALHWAILTESMIAVDALISSNKCDFSLRNNKDENFLHIAVRSALINTLTFESMVKAGTDIEARDQLGLTPLDIAQACNNKVAIKAFSRCRQLTTDVTQDSDGNTNTLVDNLDSQTNPRKLCDEYKQKYISKNRENLEYEKRLIQLTAQIERLKLDMNFMKEQSEKLEVDYEKLSSENMKLKNENTTLLEQINNDKKRYIGARVNGKARSDTGGGDRNVEVVDKFDTIECREHEEFLVAKGLLQERINKLKYSLTSVQP